MPRLVRQFARAGPGPPLLAAGEQADGTTVLTGCPAAPAAPLDRIQAPGWPAKPSVASVKVKVCGESVLKRFNVVPLVIATVVWLAGNRFGQIKLNDDPLAWTVADRALQAAQAGHDPLTLADSRRAVATVMRRTGRRTRARELLISAAADIEPRGHATPGQLSMYGTLLEVAAYTTAVDGSRAAATELLEEAQATATRLGRDANYRFTAFGPSNVALYQVSIAQVLGDSGTAIEHAKTMRPSAIPTAERRGRYWIDVARAYHQWANPGPATTRSYPPSGPHPPKSATAPPSTR